MGYIVGNTICEGWNNAFRQLTGHKHPSVWTLVEGFQQYHTLVTTSLLQDGLGTHHMAVRRGWHELQQAPD